MQEFLLKIIPNKKSFLMTSSSMRPQLSPMNPVNFLRTSQNPVLNRVGVGHLGISSEAGNELNVLIWCNDGLSEGGSLTLGLWK